MGKAPSAPAGSGSSPGCIGSWPYNGWTFHFPAEKIKTTQAPFALIFLIPKKRIIRKKKKKKAKWEHFSIYPVIVFFSGHYPSQIWWGQKKIRSVLNRRKPASDYNIWIVETKHSAQWEEVWLGDSCYIIYTWKSHNIQTLRKKNTIIIIITNTLKIVCIFNGRTSDGSLQLSLQLISTTHGGTELALCCQPPWHWLGFGGLFLFSLFSFSLFLSFCFYFLFGSQRKTGGSPTNLRTTKKNTTNKKET